MLKSKIIEIDEEILLNVENNFDGENGTQIVFEPGDSIEVLPASGKLRESQMLRELTKKHNIQFRLEQLRDIIKEKKEMIKKEKAERTLKIITKSDRGRKFKESGFPDRRKIR